MDKATSIRILLVLEQIRDELIKMNNPIYIKADEPFGIEIKGGRPRKDKQ